MAGLFEILGKIKERPGMYLGKPSVENLFLFLVGYKTARRELSIAPTEEELKFYGEFQPWLQERLQIRTNNSWATLIQFCSVNDQEAFDRFFELLTEFRQLNSPQNSHSMPDQLERLKVS
jgi:hypothetical protein